MYKAILHNTGRFFAHFELFRKNGGHFEKMWIFDQVNRSMDSHEIKNLGWLVCKECGYQFVEQSDNLGRNELTLKNGQCCSYKIALATDSAQLLWSTDSLSL